jgi:prophage regulatory protein
MYPEKPDRILRINAVLKRTGLTRSTLYRKISAGTFPRQLRISTRCAGWRESAIDAWLRNPMFYRVAEEHEIRPPASKPRRRTRSPQPTCSSDEPMLPLGLDVCRKSPSDDTLLPLR